MLFNNLGLYSYWMYRRRRPGFVRRPAPVTQISSSIGGYGNDFINLGTITNVEIVPVTDVTVTPYTATIDDYFLCVDVVGPASIILPTSVVGKIYVVKDCDGDANTNNITVTATGSTIDGAASAVINTNYGSLNFVFNGTEWNIF
jgi:hypothetical protein